MPSRKLVRRYFEAWQSPADLETLRECLAEDFRLENGSIRFDNAKAFLGYLEEHHTIWENVKLLSEVYTANRAALLYSGYMPERGTEMRIAEFIEVEDGKIKLIQSVLSNP